MCHIFIHFSVRGYAGCFHVLVAVNSSAVNTGACISFWIMFLFLHCSPETIATLLVGYTPIQNEKVLK